MPFASISYEITKQLIQIICFKKFVYNNTKRINISLIFFEIMHGKYNNILNSKNIIIRKKSISIKKIKKFAKFI